MVPVQIQSRTSSLQQRDEGGQLLPCASRGGVPAGVLTAVIMLLLVMLPTFVVVFMPRQLPLLVLMRLPLVLMRLRKEVVHG